MLSYYTIKDGRPAPAKDADDHCIVWVHAEAPTPEECAELAADYRVPLSYLTAPGDYSERPRAVHKQDDCMVLVRASIKQEGPLVAPFRTCPLAAVLTPEAVITVCPKALPLEQLLPETLMGEGGRANIRLMLTLFFRISGLYIEHLRLMDERLGHFEASLKKSMRNDELLSLLHLEKSLIHLIPALKGNLGAMEKFHSFVALSDEEKDLLSEALIEARQALDMAEIFSMIMGSLSDAFGAIVSNNLNKVMKFLTGMTLVMMVPGILSGIYGMNVPLPFSGEAHAFWYIGGSCLFLCTALWLYFSKKDWL